VAKVERILVIGGARALGAAVARRAVNDGYGVVIGARDLAAAEALADAIDATAVRIDLQDETTMAAAATRLADGIDHIVTTGSAPHDVRAADLDHDKLVAAFTAKAIGPMLVAKHFAPVLRPNGSVVLFSGVVGWRPGPGSLVKGVTNGAVEYVARHLAADLAPVRVNAISPGVVDSGAWDRLGRPQGRRAEQECRRNAGRTVRRGRRRRRRGDVAAPRGLHLRRDGPPRGRRPPQDLLMSREPMKRGPPGRAPSEC
jgi:NAD(P)-dependent dehydrogenase (short-subunit alcohol dehydrogenase family)